MKYKSKEFLIQVETTPGSGIYATVAALVSNNLTFSNAQVDISHASNTPWRELAAGIATYAVTLAGNGFVTDAVTFEQVQNASLLSQLLKYRIISGLGDTWVGKFSVGSVALVGDLAGSETYNFSFESSGIITHTSLPRVAIPVIAP